ncbi:MAG TPA: hypothetical protein VGD66_02440 [Allosphingosinicella sp.]
MDLRLDDFAEAVGESYELLLGDEAVSLVLERTQELPRSIRDAGSFRLEWRGPASPVIEQSVYTFRRGDRTFEMFIVPVGKSEAGILYEAIFT